jgi:tetratricopeptide (TPR) repeat protein
MPSDPNERHQIRVFVSSTFRDMIEERNYLVKFIFPQLRHLCEARMVVWGEVDLRWGVSDEQVAEGKVLPSCLEQIRRCRPYFIGILGERYGWIPEAIPQEIIEREPWLKEYVQEGKSVTELEILHGVLRNPDMAEHAFFYFRDPNYIDCIPMGKRDDYICKDKAQAEKLAALKEQVRHSNFPLRENYADPKALGELVLKDFTELISGLFPENEIPDPLDREAFNHEAFAQSREKVYIGRPEYFERLDSYADSSGTEPLVILGESGSGKSALLANWVKHYREKHSDIFIIQHYIGATPYSSDWAAMLRRILGELKKRFNIGHEISNKPNELRSAFPNWLYMTGAKGKAIIVLDALNQLEDKEGAPDLVWLPPIMPENVKLIVSTLPGRPLDEIKKRNWPTLEVKALTLDERKALIFQLLDEYGRNRESIPVEKIAKAGQTENPLYLSVLLDELRQFGEHEKLNEYLNGYLEAKTVIELYHRVIERWDKDYSAGQDLVYQALSLLWASRRGLSESELLQILGREEEPLPQATWSPLYLSMANSLVNRAGLLNFSHDFLRTTAKEACLPTEEAQHKAHIRLANYFQAQPSSNRKTDELPWQLCEAAEWQKLYDLLANGNFFKEAWDKNQYDVKAYWASIEGSSQLRIVDAYHLQLDLSEHKSDSDFIWALSTLLDNTGYLKEALSMRSALAKHFKLTDDQHNYQASLGGQALTLMALGNLDMAMVLYKKQEDICRRIGNLEGLSASLGNQAIILYWQGELDKAGNLLKEAELCHIQQENMAGLQACLGNQAIILKDRGDLNGAMVLMSRQERICHQLGNLAGLQACLGNRALILYSRGDLDGAMALHKEQERICRQLGDHDGLQYSLGNQALIWKDRGNYQLAAALYKEQEMICRRIGNLDSLQVSLGGQAKIIFSLGDLESAMVLHREEEHICRKLGNLNDLSNSLGNQANILYSLGDLEDAMILYKEQERISHQLGNLDTKSISIGNQALVLFTRGNLDGAMALHKEEERICRQLGKLDGIQRSIANQGNILYIQGSLNEAELRYKESEQICRQLGNLNDLQGNLCNQSLILIDRGDLNGAMAMLEEVKGICHQLGNLAGLQACFGNQALIFYSRGDLDGAMALHKEQERLCRQLENIDGLQNSLSGQARILHSLGDGTGSLVLYKEQERLCRQLGNLNGLQSSLGGQAVLFTESGDIDQAMALYQEQKQICQQLGNLRCLQFNLGCQSAIFLARGDIEGALKLLMDKENICRQIGDIKGLTYALLNQAILLAKTDKTIKALPLVKEAYNSALKHNYHELAEHIEPIFNAISQATREK